MFRRLVATALWAYFGWYLAAYLVAFVDAPSGLSVVGGMVMGFAASVDLRRRRRPLARAMGTTVPSA